MGIEFNALTGLATGGAAITSYWLEMDSTGSGAGPFVEIGGYTTPSLQTNYVITGLVSGNTYYFRYWVHNS